MRIKSEIISDFIKTRNSSKRYFQLGYMLFGAIRDTAQTREIERFADDRLVKYRDQANLSEKAVLSVKAFIAGDRKQVRKLNEAD